jgi:3',5'-cyclic AMP phosphodiesterase CpdA
MKMLWMVVVVVGGITGCESPSPVQNVDTDPQTSTSEAAAPQAAAPQASAQATAQEAAPSKDSAGANNFAAAPTIVVGDLHGDIDPLHELLAKTGLAAGDRWTGGDRTLIQTGDVLDRGDDEREIYELLWALQKQAEKAGGRVVLMNGNHEVMNVMGDLRYVTAGGAADFGDFELPDDPKFTKVPSSMRGRLAAFLPGGEWAKKLSQQPVVAKVDGRLYAHGGVHKQHVDYGLDAINGEMAKWMLEGGVPPLWATAQDGPLWTREWSGTDSPDCARLDKLLEAAKAKSLAVGHTPQRSGVTSRCGGKLWLIDTGMAEHYGGPTQAIGVLPSGRVGVIR